MVSLKNSNIRLKFQFSIFLVLGAFVLEIAGGIWTHSLSLLSDAAHLFMDAFSLTLSWAALRLAERPATDTRTFGLHRAETFAAFINGFSLTLIALWILVVALRRLSHPEPVYSSGMLAIAIIGFMVNLVVALKLRGHDHMDLNLRSAFLHVMGDLLASIGVILGALIIGFTHWYAVDPLISLGIAIAILIGSLNILKKSSHILLEGVPESISYGDVHRAFREIQGVEDVHELHIWSLCSNVNFLSTHVVVDDQMVSRLAEIMDKINHVMLEDFHIVHTTLQFECRENSHGHAICAIRH